jgi:hypothetical protein
MIKHVWFLCPSFSFVTGTTDDFKIDLMSFVLIFIGGVAEQNL